jgi:hypothetical protein
MAGAVEECAQEWTGPTFVVRSWQRSELSCTNPVKTVARGDESPVPVEGGSPIVGSQGVGEMVDGPGLVLVHGRSQQMPSAARRGPAEEAAFVARKRQSWLAGLSKGLVEAGLPAVDPAAVTFP